MANKDELTMDCILYIGTLFDKWRNLLSKEEVNELHKKIRYCDRCDSINRKIL